MSTPERPPASAESDRLPPVCILAGGLATRLGSRVADTPKALLTVAGEPFLCHQLRLLAEHGADRIVLCVGYLGEQIERRIGAERYGLEILYSHDGARPLGTLGAVRRAVAHLGPRFLVLYGDTYLRIDYQAVARAWEHSDRPAVMAVLRNAGRWDTSNAEFDGRTVVRYDKRAPAPQMEWIDYGLGGLEAGSLDVVDDATTDLAELYAALAARGELLGYAATERFYEIGTPAALAETDAFLSRGERERARSQSSRSPSATASSATTTQGNS